MLGITSLFWPNLVGREFNPDLVGLFREIKNAPIIIARAMKKPNTKKADGSIETSYDFKHLLNATDKEQGLC